MPLKFVTTHPQLALALAKKCLAIEISCRARGVKPKSAVKPKGAIVAQTRLAEAVNRLRGLAMQRAGQTDALRVDCIRVHVCVFELITVKSQKNSELLILKTRNITNS